jgi:hypothetical protein
MKLDDLKKLEHESRPRQASVDDDAQISAIVKVRRPNYVPPGLTVRSRIDDLMFTASGRAGALRHLDDDPDVESVALPRPLPNVD